MSGTVYHVSALLAEVLRSVGVGTNLALLCLSWAVLSGRLLSSRGAVTSALAGLGLNPGCVRRSVAALSYGRFSLERVLERWCQAVERERQFVPSRYGGYRPVACDLVGFFRPRLGGEVGQHYHSLSQRVQPALVFALLAAVGRVGATRFPLLRKVIRSTAQESDTAFYRRVLGEVQTSLAADEALVVDAGFCLADLLASSGRFVARAPKNLCARRNTLPPYPGRGRRGSYGERVRPLDRVRKKQRIEATPADQVLTFQVGKHRVSARVYKNLVQSSQKPGAPCFTCMVFHDRRYHDPLVLATNLSVSPKALYLLYKDRWPIEKAPLAAKQMLGAERAFVFGKESRHRLPEIALLCGNILAYVAATAQPAATGFWDRAARPTCGRLRRTLERVHFFELTWDTSRFREKASPTEHLTKGVLAHRRTKSAAVTGK